MKISKLRRALAVFLSAAMLIMCMPFTGISAAAVTDTTSCVYITVDGTVNTASEVDPDAEWSSGTLSNALTVANDMHNGKTVYIKMLSDVTGDNYGQTISFSAYNGNTVFDLNGHSVDGNNAYRCVYAKSKGTLTISSSASSRGTITNGYSESDGAAGIYHEYGTLTLSNVNVTNNTLKGRYGAGVTSLSTSTSTTLSNVKISGNQSLYSSDSFAGGFMPYKPFTLKNQVEITGNSNSFSNDRNFYPVLVVGDVSKSSISGLTAGSEIKIWNNSGKVTISGDGGNNPDIYNYFTLTNDNYWLAPTATGGLQATNSVYGVIFDMQGKTDNVVNTVSSGAKVTKPSDPTASDGSTFGGWYKDKECTQAFDFSTAINANTTLYAKWATVYPDTVQLLEGVTLTPTDNTCTQYKISGLPSGDYEYYYFLYFDSTARVIYDQLYQDYSMYIGKSTDEVTVNVNDMKAVKNGDTITLAMDVSICRPIYMVRLFQVKTGGSDISRNVCAYEGYFIGPKGNTVDIGKKIEALDGVTLTPNASKTKYTVELPEIEEGYMYAYGLETLGINEELPEEQINEATNFVNGMVSDIVGKSVGSHSWAPDIFNEIKSGDTIDVSNYSFIFIDKFKKPASETDYNALDLDGSYKSYAYYGNFIGTYAAPDPSEYDITTEQIKASDSGYMDLKPGTRIYVNSDTFKKGNAARKFFADTYEAAVKMKYIDGELTDADTEYLYFYTESLDYGSIITLKPKYQANQHGDGDILCGGTWRCTVDGERDGVLEVYSTTPTKDCPDPDNPTEPEKPEEPEEPEDPEKPEEPEKPEDPEKPEEPEKPEDPEHTHSFGEWKTVIEATETEEGMLVRECSCGESEIKFTPKLTPVTDDPDNGNINDKTPDTNVGGAELANVMEVVNNIEINPEESLAMANGEDMNIILDVKSGSVSAPAEDVEKVNEAVSENGIKLGMILDISLFKQIGNNPATAITETKEPITITFKMPEALINPDGAVDRTYYIIRVHDGKTDIIFGTYNAETNEFTFKTDKFSTYAIAYSDKAKSTSAPTFPVDLGNDSRVHADKSKASVGEKVTLSVASGYKALVFSGDNVIASIVGTGSFIMPKGGVTVRVTVICNPAVMGAYKNSYIYSYDSDMNYITVNRTKKQGTITVNLGKAYAGKSFVIYEGKKSTSVKVTEGTLDNNGKFTLEVDYGKNYTLVVED